jgi:hypothetical protein
VNKHRWSSQRKFLIFSTTKSRWENLNNILIRRQTRAHECTNDSRIYRICRWRLKTLLINSWGLLMLAIKWFHAAKQQPHHQKYIKSINIWCHIWYSTQIFELVVRAVRQHSEMFGFSSLTSQFHILAEARAILTERKYNERNDEKKLLFYL